MSDVLTPKEQLTAYQRWELPAFDFAKPGESQAGVNLPTAAQVEQTHMQAHEEGYQAGYAEGKQKADVEAQRLVQMMNALNRELQQIDQKIAQDLLELSLEVAKQMLQQALKVKPELLLEIVQNTISELPPFNQHAHLVLHPADAELVRARVGEQLSHTGWKIRCREGRHAAMTACDGLHRSRALSGRVMRHCGPLGNPRGWPAPSEAPAGIEPPGHAGIDRPGGSAVQRRFGKHPPRRFLAPRLGAHRWLPQDPGLAF